MGRGGGRAVRKDWEDGRSAVGLGGPGKVVYGFEAPLPTIIGLGNLAVLDCDRVLNMSVARGALGEGGTCSTAGKGMAIADGLVPRILEALMLGFRDAFAWAVSIRSEEEAGEGVEVPFCATRREGTGDGFRELLREGFLDGLSGSEVSEEGKSLLEGAGEGALEGDAGAREDCSFSCSGCWLSGEGGRTKLDGVGDGALDGGWAGDRVLLSFSFVKAIARTRTAGGGGELFLDDGGLASFASSRLSSTFASGSDTIVGLSGGVGRDALASRCWSSRKDVTVLTLRVWESVDGDLEGVDIEDEEVGNGTEDTLSSPVASPSPSPSPSSVSNTLTEIFECFVAVDRDLPLPRQVGNNGGHVSESFLSRALLNSSRVADCGVGGNEPAEAGGVGQGDSEGSEER